MACVQFHPRPGGRGQGPAENRISVENTKLDAYTALDAVENREPLTTPAKQRLASGFRRSGREATPAARVVQLAVDLSYCTCGRKAESGCARPEARGSLNGRR
jgi:hypothetical protein